MEHFLFDDLFGINQIYVDRFFCEALHDAVASGDIDEVEQLLDEPGSDINSIFFGENLLWTAIASNQPEMARFLIDNGVDTKFSCCQVDLQEQDDRAEHKESGKDGNKSGAKSKLLATLALIPEQQQAEQDSAIPATVFADLYEVSCRQLAYERKLYEIVNLIDYKQGEHPRWLNPPTHEPRLTKTALHRQHEQEELLSLPNISDRRAVTITSPPLFTVSQTPDIPRKTSPCKSEMLQRVTSDYRFLHSALSLPEPSFDRSPRPNRSLTKRSAFVKPHPPNQHSSASYFQLNPSHPYRLNKTYMARAAVSATDCSLKLRHPERPTVPKTRYRPKELVERYKFDQHCDKSEHLVDTIASKFDHERLVNGSSKTKQNILVNSKNNNRQKKIVGPCSILLRARAGLRLNEKHRKEVRINMTHRLKQNAVLNRLRRIETAS